MTGLPGAGRGGKIEYAMPTDLTVILEHRPGELARLGEIAGEAGVTIHGFAAFTGEGRVSCTCSLTMRPWLDAGRRLSAPEWGSPTSARSSWSPSMTGLRPLVS